MSFAPKKEVWDATHERDAGVVDRAPGTASTSRRAATRGVAPPPRVDPSFSFADDESSEWLSEWGDAPRGAHETDRPGWRGGGSSTSGSGGGGGWRRRRWKRRRRGERRRGWRNPLPSPGRLAAQVPPRLPCPSRCPGWGSLRTAARGTSAFGCPGDGPECIASKCKHLGHGCGGMCMPFVLHATSKRDLTRIKTHSKRTGVVAVTLL